MSRNMGKPTICLGENKGADQLHGNREADQRLCFRYSDSTLPLLLKFGIHMSCVIKKTVLRVSQTSIHSHRRSLEVCIIGFNKKGDCTIWVAKTKVLISCAVTVQLICDFVFAYHKNPVLTWFMSLIMLSDKKSAWLKDRIAGKFEIILTNGVICFNIYSYCK